MTGVQARTMRLIVGGAARRAVRYRGMLVLVLWQAPIQPVVHPNGSLGLIIGGGRDELADLSCEGDLISSERVRHQVAAVQADYSPNELMRFDAVAGYMWSDHDSHEGPFATVLLRADWRAIGIGGGMAISPGFDEDGSSSSAAWPSAYLRIGSRESAHLRADLFPPTAFAAQQIGRLGVGYNAVRRDRPSIFVGLAGVGSNEGATGIAAEVTLPVASRFSLNAQGHWGDGELYSVTGLAVGGRYLFGGPGQAGRITR